MSERIKYTELLAPARNAETAFAAIDYGADAVYMGASKFGARHAAGNSAGEMAKVADYARQYGVRVYATLNTVLFDDELKEAESIAREVISAGADALIIQDMAYLEMGLPAVEFHASTQTYNASPEKVKFLQESGFSRVILERGLSLEQIKAIRNATEVDLECFVHGAICVGNSGRCWLSRTMSPRSGNRGECSQPCRLTYDLSDGNFKPLLRGKHLLSVMDLDLSDRLGDLLDAGITTFKIEGRLKDINYVKNNVSYYRRRLDEELSARKGFRRRSVGESLTDFIPDTSKTFTRGGSQYFFDGLRGGVASFNTPKALGSYIGKVTARGEEWFGTDAETEMNAGDGICFFADGKLEGTNINKVQGKRVFPNKMSGIERGTEIYRNYDHKFTTALERDEVRRVIDVTAEAEVFERGIELCFTDIEGVTAVAECAGNFEPAVNPDKMTETIRNQIAKSGDTVFRVTEAVVKSEGIVPFIPVSTVNALRREGLERLMSERAKKRPERSCLAKRDDSFPYMSKTVSAFDNVTNHLARRFYERHGVEIFEEPLELYDDYDGARVMQTPYCIRREIGECLKNRPRSSDTLYLQHGAHRYRLVFDCERCMMSLVCEKSGRSVSGSPKKY